MCVQVSRTYAPALAQQLFGNTVFHQDCKVDRRVAVRRQAVDFRTASSNAFTSALSPSIAAQWIAQNPAADVAFTSARRASRS